MHAVQSPLIQGMLDFGCNEDLQKKVLHVQVKVVEGYCSALSQTGTPLKFSQPAAEQGKDMKVLISWDQ